MLPILHVTKVEALSSHRLRVALDDETTGEADLTALVAAFDA